jgi:hypothetical protein
MIEVENMFEDLRNDEVGRAICSLRASPDWNAAKHILKEALYAKLIEYQYVKAVSTRARFRMFGGLGFSYLYLVPTNKKRGQFEAYAGQLLRLVYVASAKDYLEIRFGVVDRSQICRSFYSMKAAESTEDFDPRRYYQFALGEPGYNATLSQKPI